MSEEKVSLSGNRMMPQPGEPGYVTPAAAVPLPSKGKVYPAGSKLHCADVLEIKAMTAREEDILTSSSLLKQGKVMSALLRSCIIDRDVDPEQMVAGDRNAVLIAIRITGYGANYVAGVQCPECSELNKHEFDLSKLEVKPLGADPVAVGSNVFSFVLPVSGHEVKFKLLTGADERELSQVLEKSKKASGGLESAVTTRLLFAVLSVGSESDRNKLAAMIRNMPARDSRELRTYMDRVSPGVKMLQEFDCSACGSRSEVDIPLGMEFFWPSGD